MANKKTPEVNSSSMADIAFLLLIFWLMTTSMNVDTGINRILPPMVDKENDPGMQAHERNVLMVMISGNNQLLVDGERIDISALVEKTKHFVTNPTNDPNMPEKEVQDLPILGSFPVTKAVVSLQNDRGTNYQMYIRVQNELTKAYNLARNELSLQKFGRAYKDLQPEAKTAIDKAIPLRISEAEPRDLTSRR